ncbi:MAG TPA: type I methionyl aminopeptidase, partial [Beijerinckiaceae bacterium]|nr:type I methionyl aminopeptidase [Beijerinckiaceae bacterium]
MTVSSDDELTALRRIGRIVGDTLEAMRKAIEPGMTTLELDQVGRG